jgi:hypothetical protein
LQKGPACRQAGGNEKPTATKERGLAMESLTRNAMEGFALKKCHRFTDLIIFGSVLFLIVYTLVSDCGLESKNLQ